MIDCSGNTELINQTWCVNIFGYTQGSLGAHSKVEDYISVPAPAQILTEEPNGLLKMGKLSVSAYSAGQGGSVVLSTVLTAKGTASDVSVTFYDGEPGSGGRQFASEQVPSISADAQREVQTTYQTEVCGMHQLFAVVNRGKSTEIVRRAPPVRVSCTSD